MAYNPPFSITPTILKQVAEISETIGRLSARIEQTQALRLRRADRCGAISTRWCRCHVGRYRCAHGAGR